MKIFRGTIFSSLLLALSACSSVYLGKLPEGGERRALKRKGAAALALRQRQPKAIPSVPQPPYRAARTRPEVAAYDVGAHADAQGNLVGPHRVYRVVESPHWRLRFPWSRGEETFGPKGAYLPPNYRPVPLDQRMKDELADLEKAKRELQDAAAEVHQKLQEADPLKERLAQLEEENRQLKAQQVNKALGVKTPNGPSAPSSSGPAAAGEAAADANDPLKNWNP